VILDSCFLIDLMASDAGAVAKLDGLVEDNRRLSVATVSVTEVARGIADEERRAAFDDVLARLDVIPYDRNAAERAANILRSLDESGAPIGAVDAMVAATALSGDGIVVTRNVAEFRRVDGVRVEPY
jgi:predicted nucleic acid-binding protein